MIKKNKWKLLISSVLILLPGLFGLIFWEKLPEQMVTHWGTNGTADGLSSKPFAVIGLPLVILAVHLLCVFFTANDPKNKNQNKKVFGLVLWICPIASLFAGGMIYADAFGKEFHIETLAPLFIGLLFVVLGNYLPKCKQNYTIGIKLIWTLENEENWNATHRRCGKLWVAGGLLLMACVFMPEAVISWVLVATMVVLAIYPVIYSYRYHKKQEKAGK